MFVAQSEKVEDSQSLMMMGTVGMTGGAEAPMGLSKTAVYLKMVVVIYF